MVLLSSRTQILGTWGGVGRQETTQSCTCVRLILSQVAVEIPVKISPDMSQYNETNKARSFNVNVRHGHIYQSEYM